MDVFVLQSANFRFVAVLVAKQPASMLLPAYVEFQALGIECKGVLSAGV